MIDPTTVTNQPDSIETYGQDDREQLAKRIRSALLTAYEYGVKAQAGEVNYQHKEKLIDDLVYFIVVDL